MTDDKNHLDPFSRQHIYPDASAIIDFRPTTVESALKGGIIALDTNVLLVPYGTGKASIEQIRTVYGKLAGENRLRVPGQVTREFAANRAERLKTLYQQLSLKRNASITPSQYPLLEGLSEYDALRKAETQLGQSMADYRSLVGKLLAVVSGWNWNDPVTLIYQDTFKPGVVIDPPLNQDDVRKELQYRFTNQIPPGYKDAKNEHAGIGDFLIWKSLLQIGENEKKDLVFVSGDEKSDWWYRSDNTALYPRFELVDEYRRSSAGRSFFMISFADLLQHFGAPSDVVDEIRDEELSVAASEAQASPRRGDITVRAVRRWLQRRYPDAKILAGNKLIELWVHRPNSPRLGIDIRRYTEREQVRGVVSAVIKAHADRKTAIAIVAVFRDIELIDDAVPLLVNSLKGTSVVQVLVGTVSDGEFLEFQSYDLSGT